jgi:ATP-dependent helicase HrpA
LTAALAEQLQRITGVQVPEHAWRPELLPEYLFAFFEVSDEHGKKLDSGRDLRQLQLRLGGHAQDRFATVSDARYERKNIREWDFGALPEFVELDHGGVKLRGYPALAVIDGVIELRLFDKWEDAATSHMQGLLALFRSKLGRQVKDISRAVPHMSKQVLWFSTVAGAETLQADLELAVIQAAFAVNQVDIRDADTFERRFKEGRQRLLELAAAIGGWSFEALQAHHDLNRLVKGAVSPQLIAAIGEVKEQSQQLIYPGFVSSTPLPWLPHLARYIRAAVHRLERLPGNVERDCKQSAVVRRYWQRYQQLAGKKPPSEALTHFRWMIEELRVSLFAQELGTAEKVSPQRLDRLWEELG